MKRFSTIAALLLFLAACGVATPPRDLSNACAILNERPHYARAISASARKWGVPMHVQMATIHQESRFVSNAKTQRTYLFWVIPWGRQSSAYGYSQALDGTWRDYQRDEGGSWARRDNMQHAADFIGWYMHGSSRILGISKHDAAAQYLAYHEGRGGFAKGSHRNKAWLMNVAQKVAARSKTYERQLRSCGY